MVKVSCTEWRNLFMAHDTVPIWVRPCLIRLTIFWKSFQCIEQGLIWVLEIWWFLMNTNYIEIIDAVNLSVNDWLDTNKPQRRRQSARFKLFVRFRPWVAPFELVLTTASSRTPPRLHLRLSLCLSKLLFFRSLSFFSSAYLEHFQQAIHWL